MCTVVPAHDSGNTWPRRWSLDALAATQPRRTFHHLESHLPAGGAWIAIRRPLFLAILLGCAASILAAGVLTLRLAVSATVYWSYVPLAEVISVALVTRRARRLARLSLSQTIDAFFVGHGAATMFVLALVGTLSILPATQWWNVLTGPALLIFVLVILWSAWVDACFFRYVLRLPRGAVIRALLTQRALTWTMVFVLFAVPAPRAFLTELADALKELS